MDGVRLFEVSHLVLLALWGEVGGVVILPGDGELRALQVGVRARSVQQEAVSLLADCGVVQADLM